VLPSRRARRAADRFEDEADEGAESMRMSSISGEERDFTLVELMVVIIIIGVIVFAGTLEFRSVNANTRMNSAASQVSRSLQDAYSMAQAEKVKVTVKFYSNTDADAAKRNKYEVLRGDANESVRPPAGVSYDKVSSSYYCKMPNGGSQPTITAPVTIVFKPMGSTTRLYDEVSSAPGTSASVSLAYSGLSNKIITVNSEGEVSP